MSKKRKKGMVKKARVRKRALASEEGLECTPNIGPTTAQMNQRIPRSYASAHKAFNDYFIAHPTKQSASVGEIIEYLSATDCLTLRLIQSNAVEFNNPGKSLAESKLLEPPTESKAASSPPPFGERLLLLILTKENRANIPGDLEEEFKEIAAKHGARYAKLWYYKQVAASAWPLMRKAVGWGLLASLGAWIRRYI